MLKIIISFTTFVSLCLLIAALNLTTPASAGPFGVLVIFAFAYLSSLGLVTFFLFFISRIVAYLSKIFIANNPVTPITLKRSYLFSTIIAAAPVMIIGLKSVGVVGFYEYLLVLIFVTIGCLYVSKRIH